jgi:hypothetical protein
MTGTWFSIRVDLVAGHGELYWPRPGGIFAAAPTHTFAQLATAIDDAFARWDRSHLHQFTRSHGSEPGIPSRQDELSARVLDYRRVKLAQLQGGEQFAYVFDFGDQWEHLCSETCTCGRKGNNSGELIRCPGNYRVHQGRWRLRVHRRTAVASG